MEIKKIKIIATIIVKNESNHLTNCLESIKGIDEIYITDTGSTDNTVEIAKKYTDKITFFPWTDSFEEARNFALQQVPDDGNTYIAIIDADEELKTPVAELYSAITLSKAKGFKTISCRVVSKRTKQTHYQPRIFKRCPEIFWKGKAHNYLSYMDNNPSDITIEYGYSDAHKKDPDRALRILRKVVEEQPSCVREKYYLAREYWYRKKWHEAMIMFDTYLNCTTTNLGEKADGWLYRARIHWILKERQKAITACFKAIELNPAFREALNFMGDLYNEPWKSKWKTLAKHADNDGVLFIR